MTPIIQTQFLLPGFIVSNGIITGNEWENPNNILYVDGYLALSNIDQGNSSDMIIGGFNPNLPADAIVVGIELKLIAKAGSDTVPPTTLTLYAVDNTGTTDLLFPYTAPIGLSLELDPYILGTPTYLFGQTALTYDQVNNLKIALVANGDISVDSILMNVYYWVPATPGPSPAEAPGCPTYNSPIQVPIMYLQLPFEVGDTEFYLTPGSMQYADGTPVQATDVGACGGEIDFVFDKGVIKAGPEDVFEENVALDLSTGYWEVLPSGIVKVVLASINDRGLLPHTPYTHVAALMSDHNANTPVIISNSARFYSRFQVGGALPKLIYNEVVAGNVQTFTLAHTPNAGTLQLYANGVRLVLGVGYTITGAVITTTATYSTGNLLADYSYQA